MSVILNQHTELNPVQVSLLRLFNRPMTEAEVLEVRKMLVSHFSTLLEEEVNKTAKEKGYTQDDFDKMLNADS